MKCPKCNSDLEAQFVCENCGRRESMPDRRAVAEKIAEELDAAGYLLDAYTDDPLTPEQLVKISTTIERAMGEA
jgi:peptide subunit release factor 1 (eRF1)